MRLYKGTRKWTFLHFVILSVALGVECFDHRTFNLSPGRSIDSMPPKIAVPVPANQFASRKGSLDIDSQYWRDPEYSEEPDVDADSIPEEGEVDPRHAYVQVDRKGREHTFTINMPRMEGKGGRNHMIKKFVLKPVIQYVVQYDKDKDKMEKNREEIQAQGTSNLEEYEGYQGQRQEKRGRDHGKNLDSFFNEIDAKFENFWGNDGNGQGGQGYQEQGGGFGRAQEGHIGIGGGSQSGQLGQAGYDATSARNQQQFESGGNNHGGSGVAHDFGFTIEGQTGGYSSTNQFHQPPDVNAHVSTGGYGSPQSNIVNGGTQQPTASGFGQGKINNFMNSAPQQSGQLYTAPGLQNTPSVSVTSNGLSGMAHTSSNTGQSGFFGSTQSMSHDTPVQTMGVIGGTMSNSPTGSLNSLYGVPGMTSGRPLGMVNGMMTNTMNGGAIASGISMMAPTATNSMTGMVQAMQGQSQMAPATAGSRGMVTGSQAQIQNAPMIPGQIGTQTMGMGGTMMGGAGSSSTVSGSFSSSSSGAATGVTGPSTSDINSAIAALIKMGVNVGASGSNTAGASGVSIPRPSINNMAGSISVDHPSTSYVAPSAMDGSPSVSYGPPKENITPPPSSSYGPPPPPKNPPGGYGESSPSNSGGYGEGSSSSSGKDDGGSRGKAKKQKGSSGGKKRGRGSRGGRSFLSSLPLPKIAQNFGGHFSFMLSSGFGKSRRNRGGRMSGGGGGGGDDKPRESQSKNLSKEQVSDHILTILGLSPAQSNLTNLSKSNPPPLNNASLANHTTNPILLWEQNGYPSNSTSLNHNHNHTSNRQEDMEEDIIEDVVDLLPVDKEFIPNPTPTVKTLNSEELEVIPSDLPNTEMTTTEMPTTTAVLQTEEEIVPLESKPSNQILIATVQPSKLRPLNESIKTTTTTAPPKNDNMNVLNKNILIATVPPSLPPLKALMPPVLIATVPPRPSSTQTSMKTKATTETTSKPATLPPPITNPITNMTTFTTPMTMTPVTNANHSTMIPIDFDFTRLLRAGPRQGKNLPLPLIATLPPPQTPMALADNFPRRTPPPHPTPSISIEFHPIQDLLLGSNSQPNFLPPSPPPPLRSNRLPNIQAYYAEHNLTPNPVKIQHFDPEIYTALDATFNPKYNDNQLLEEGRKKKRSQFSASLITSPFQYPFPLRRSRSFFGRLTERLSNGKNDSLAVIPSTTVNNSGEGPS